MRTKFLLLCMLTVVISGASLVKADVILPTGVGKYRIIFVTYGVFTAEANNIGWYNFQVESEAASSAILNGLGAEWYCVGSTWNVDARDNVSPGFDWETETIPIYNTAGELIADDLVDLFDGDLYNPVMWTQFGDYPSIPLVFTGSQPDGTRSPFELGDLAPTYTSTFGFYDASDFAWIEEGGSMITSTHALYGISSTVPEPATVCLLGFGGLALLRRSRRRLHS